ncbi:dna repair protein rad8 [Ceraceosorus bombacis]|uniref:Dna repair protein rad8 n=1 Tax=Ceraceosorus bombacis TaxID=401625 RepID=A0A0P1BMN4_9BASI|nr:dna repair protein rad8 [Ceraceosorus bombacis]
MARFPPSSQGTRSGRSRVRVYQIEDSSDEELLRGPKKALSSKGKRIASDSESDFVLEEEDQSDEEDEDEDIEDSSDEELLRGPKKALSSKRKRIASDSESDFVLEEEDQSDEEDEDEDVAEAEEEESTDERESTGTPALTESMGASAESSEVTTPMNQPGNRFEVLDDDCFKNGTDPVVVAPIKVDAGLAKSSLAIVTVTQGQSTKKFRQTRLSFGKSAAQSPAKSQSSRVQRATPDFIASDDDSDFGGPSKKRRKSASSTKSKPSTSSSVHWVPEFRKDRKVKYRNFVPDMPKATLMAAAAKDDALEGRLPPMHDLDEIFADIVKRCDTTAIVELAKTLQGRPLRVATMCSGTESPLLALNLMSRACKAQHGIDIEVHHVFSCEIEPYKQAYIERNFAPPILFRDVCELGDDQAHTAYGALVDVPGDVDLLVAGTSCVDYSGLNNKKKGMEEGGESGRTFYGMLNWVERHKPAIVILENVKSAPWAGVAQAFVDIDYDAAFCNTFDTKHYYIPHTRQRGYLIATHNNKDDYPANWEALTKSMSRPASSTLESFLLPTDDPRIQHVRLQFALGEGYGKGRSTIDWSRCQGRHERARDEEALGKSRPFTAWEEGGGCKLSHDAWNEWALPMPERVLDLLDITTLRCAKEGFDPNFKSRVWELSQNVDRNIASSKPGTVGCLTPSGMPYLTSRGGPLVGIEALALQGLPIDELLLSRETNDQLQNLAGNAMSSTVVGTCVMAALLIAQPDLAARRQGKDVSMEIEKKIQEVQEKPDSVLGQLVRQPYDLDDHAQDLDLGHLLKHAVESAQRCSCEGRTGVSDKKIFKCSACEHTACATCKGRPEHLFELDERSRQRPEAFEAQLKKYLPMRLRLQLGDAAISSRGLQTVDTFAQWRTHVNKVCQDVVLHFNGLLRQRKWTAVFLGNQTRLELILDPQTPHWDLYVEPNAEEASRGALRALLLRPCGTANGALHVKRNRDSRAARTYLFLDPHRLEGKEADSFVFAPNFDPLPFPLERAVIGRLQPGWRLPGPIETTSSTVDLLSESRQDTAPATLSWRLSAIDKALDEFNIPSYKLRSNREDTEAPTPALFRLELRKEQRRSLSWMLGQEADAVAPFVEEEVSEGLLTPMGWRAEGKATRPVMVRGGVVADAVGYGKTAITLGLVAARRQAARERKPSKDKRYIQTKATLVIVPPHLCKQWANEVTKFTGNKLKVRVIHSKAELNAATIENIKEADLIIMSVTIYKSDAYFESLSRLAAANPLPAKAGRFFEAALTQSLAALRNRMQELQTEGVAKVLDSVKRRVDFDETHLTSAKRSKRLIGQAYADAHAEEGDRTTTTGGKRKPKQKAKSKRHASDSEEDDFLDDSPPRRKAAKPKTSSIPADPWGLGSASARKSFGSLRAMPLECFMWERVVVDEFHYIAANADRAFSAIRNLASHSTWILSGTPPTADFADVKSIAAFLNIHLGVDDDADSSKQSVRSRREKERTLVERFRNFVEIRSPAWHHRRQALAQGFLDQFVRQNIAEIDEIPFTEHMQAAAHFMLDDIETTDAIEACDFIVRERRRQRDECLKQLRREIHEVAIPQHFVCLLQYAFRDDTNRPLVTFARNVENSAWGDAHCKPQLTKMLAQVGCTVEELDERAGRRRFPKLKKKAETSISDNWEQEFALRNTVHLLQRLRNEYWAREQSLRYFTQYDGLLAKVAEILRESNISFVRLQGTALLRSDQLDSFQNGDERCLLLNIADESAAGSNLTVANHVIFLSPLIMEEAQQYHQTMEQARGRAIRFGQTKQVHIWRFACRDTIDAQTILAREGASLEDKESSRAQ